MKEINNEQGNSNFASLPNECDEILPIQAHTSKKVFVEPTITLPVDVLETTTAFLQGGSPGSADLPPGTVPS